MEIKNSTLKIAKSDHVEFFLNILFKKLQFFLLKIKINEKNLIFLNFFNFVTLKKLYENIV